MEFQETLETQAGKRNSHHVLKQLLLKKALLCKLWKYNMTLEQSEVWNKERQVIYGPYGSGKTVLIQCKGADLALSNGNVLPLISLC